MKRKLLVVALLLLALILLPSAGLAQSKEEGIRLHKEAYALEEKARSGEELRQAAQKFEASIRIFNKVGEMKGAGYAHNSLGLIHHRCGDNTKALKEFEESLGIARKIVDPHLEGLVLMNLGTVHKELGRYDKAREFYEKGLARCRELKNRKDEGKVLNNLGVVYVLLGQYRMAGNYYDKALEIAKQEGDFKSIGQTLNNIGNVYREVGDLARAVDYYKRSMEVKRQIADAAGEGNSLTNLGTVYRHLGDYVKAAQCFEKSLRIIRAFADAAGEARVLQNLSLLYQDLGLYDKALECSKRSHEIFQKMAYANEEAKALFALGAVYQELGQYKEAALHHGQGLLICQKIGVPPTLAVFFMGTVFLDDGQVQLAERFVTASGSIESLGRLSLMKRDYPSAKKYFEQSLKHAEQNRATDNLFTAHTGLGVAYEGMGEDPRAAEHYRNAVALTEELRSTLGAAEREAFFDVRIHGFYRTAPYEGLARVLTKMNKPLEALKQSEYTKARTFTEAASKRSEYAGLDVPKEVREQDTLLNNQLGALTKNLHQAYEKDNKDAIANLEPQVKEAKEKLAAQVEMLRQKYPLFAATRYPRPMDLNKTALKDDEWVLEYDVTDTGLLIYLTKGKRLVKALLKQVQRKELDELVKKFRTAFEGITKDNLEEKLKAFDFESGKTLADLLLADVLPELPKGAALILVPDDCLGVVPFEMLPLNAGGRMTADSEVPQVTGTEFFGDRNPISYYQSVTALTLARTLGDQKRPGNKLMVMADPIFEKDDPRVIKLTRATERKLLEPLTQDVIMSAKTQNGITWPRLHRTRELAASLKKSYPGITDVYEGADANKARFMTADLKPYQSIVFGTHGYAGMDLGGLKEPVLVLTLINQPQGEDGFLRMSEVMGLKMNADLVALTACQTGLGRRISGEGTMGMGRAFQYAGAKSALMSLWNVAETTSVKLVESFFQHRKESKPKLEALKLARDEIRKSGYDHPFFWASFILVGEVR